MNLHQMTAAVSMGCVLIILGSVPGLLQWITDELRRAAESFSSPFPAFSPGKIVCDNHHRPLGLAAAGLALILLSALAYAVR